MALTKIEISIDEKVVKEEIQKKINESLISTLWFVDAKKISELSCLSVRFLEDHLFNDVRMKAIEIRFNRKRVWKADKALEVITEIFNEY